MEKLNRAVITGASSGIGEAFAYLLATQGVNLVFAARRSEHLNQLAAKLTEKFKITVETLPLDLCDEGAAENLSRLKRSQLPWVFGVLNFTLKKKQMKLIFVFVKAQWKSKMPSAHKW